MSRVQTIAAAAFVLALLAGCQDTASGPPPWTMEGVHKGVGLVGGHQQMACTGCHEQDAYTGLQAGCEACHLEAYAQVTDPDHVAGDYGTMCIACHTSQAWRPASIEHERFGFALEGAHTILLCADCHEGGVYDDLPADCWSCHASDFEATVDPDHDTQGFAQECQTCHTVVAWSPADFDHDTTGFALAGAHVAAACLACHADGFADTPTDCVGCHAQDEPRDHFGADCAACHMERAWEPSTFNHEAQFPLRSGAHRRYGNTCASCHPVSSDYERFTCTDCHDNEHTRSRTDREHREVRNYVYASANCYDCHPRGRGDDD